MALFSLMACANGVATRSVGAVIHKETGLHIQSFDGRLLYLPVSYGADDDLFFFATSRKGKFSDEGLRGHIFNPRTGSITEIASPCQAARRELPADSFSNDGSSDALASVSRTTSWTTVDGQFQSPLAYVRFLGAGRIAYRCALAFDGDTLASEPGLSQNLIVEMQLAGTSGASKQTYKVVFKSAERTPLLFDRTPSGAYVTDRVVGLERINAREILVAPASAQQVRQAEPAAILGDWCPPPVGIDEPQGRCRLVALGLSAGGEVFARVVRPSGQTATAPLAERTAAYAMFRVSADGSLAHAGSLANAGHPVQTDILDSRNGWLVFTDRDVVRATASHVERAVHAWNTSTGAVVQVLSTRSGDMADYAAVGARIDDTGRHLLMQLRSVSRNPKRVLAIFPIDARTSTLTIDAAVEVIALHGQYGEIGLSKDGRIFEFTDSEIRYLGTLRH